MAAPVDAGRTSTSIATAADPWASVNLPASIAAGDLLVVFGRTAGTATHNLPAGWQWAIQNNQADANDDATSVIWKVAAGNEGSTFSWDLSASDKGASIAYRVTGHDGAIMLPVPTPSTFTTAANTCNPPASGTLPSDDYLVLAFGGCDGETVTASAAPTSYANLVNQNSGTAGAVATNCRVWSASRGLTGITSEDPGVFTHGATAIGGTGITIVIRQLVTREADLKAMRRRHQAVKRAAYW